MAHFLTFSIGISFLLSFLNKTGETFTERAIYMYDVPIENINIHEMQKQSTNIEMNILRRKIRFSIWIQNLFPKAIGPTFILPDNRLIANVNRAKTLI